MADMLAPSPSQALCSEQAEGSVTQSRSELHFQEEAVTGVLTELHGPSRGRGLC